MLHLVVEYSGHVLNMLWGMPIVIHVKLFLGLEKEDFHMGNLNAKVLIKSFSHTTGNAYNLLD
jgi:hypothetical protein